MGNVLASCSDSFKEKYRDNSPIFLFEPHIETPQKQPLKDLIKGNRSIQLLEGFPEALVFLKSLNPSIILLFTSDYNEHDILNRFQHFQYIIKSRILSSEKEALLEGLFKGISNQVTKSLKAFRLVPTPEFLTKTPSSYIDSLIKKWNSMTDQYPLVLYEPNIETQTKQDLKNLIEGNKSINFFSEFETAAQKIQSFATSFILILSSEDNEHILLEDIQNLGFAYYRRMFDFEEEAFLKDVFKDTSESMRKSLKVHVFVTRLDFFTEMPVTEDEEEVMVMCDVQNMAKEFRQEFTVLCYDPLMNSGGKEKLEKEIEISIQENNFYTNFEELQKRLQDWKDSPYHLILSGKDEAEKIIEKIDDLKDLLGLYVYCDSTQLKQIDPEKVDVQKTLQELVPKIKEGIRTRSKLKHTFPAFATNFDTWDKSHIYNIHHYLKGLIHFKNRRQAKEDFVKLARKIYQDTDSELIEFEKDYHEYNKEKILRWYTKDSPIYKLINNCLRISSLDSILYCRFILKDIETAIREEYQQKNKEFNGEVYRGAYISAEEWEKLQKNIGEEIEMYGFLSTATLKRAALNFLRADLQNKVLITIIIPPLPELDDQGFADVSGFSAFPGEKEILFNVRSRFKILEAQISKVDSRLPKCRHLVLLYGASSLRKYMTKNKPSIQIQLTLPSEIKCMTCDSKDSLFGFNQEKTEMRCRKCLQGDSFPQNIPLLALDSEKDLKPNQTITKSFKGQFLKFHQTMNFPLTCAGCKRTEMKRYYKLIALNGPKTVSECFECFEKNQKRRFDIVLLEESSSMLWQEDQTDSEKVDSDYQVKEGFGQTEVQHQSDVYMEVQEFDLSRKYGENVVCKWSKKRFRERERLEMFFTLGLAHYQMGNNLKAQKYLLQIVDVRKAVFGEKHSSTWEAYNSLGLVYQNLGEYQQATEYHKKALDIDTGEKSLDTANSSQNLGLAYQRLGAYQQALECFLKSLEVFMEIYGDQHPQTAVSYNNLGLAYDRLGKWQQAQNYHQKALDIR